MDWKLDYKLTFNSQILLVPIKAKSVLGFVKKWAKESRDLYDLLTGTRGFLVSLQNMQWRSSHPLDTFLCVDGLRDLSKSYTTEHSQVYFIVHRKRSSFCSVKKPV